MKSKYEKGDNHVKFFIVEDCIRSVGEHVNRIFYAVFILLLQFNVILNNNMFCIT